MPYSVSATNPMGTVEQMTPATGMKLKKKTINDSTATPCSGRASAEKAQRQRESARRSSSSERRRSVQT